MAEHYVERNYPLQQYNFEGWTGTTLSSFLTFLNGKNSEIPGGASACVFFGSGGSPITKVILISVKVNSTMGGGITSSPYAECNGIKLILGSNGWVVSS